MFRRFCSIFCRRNGICGGIAACTTRCCCAIGNRLGTAFCDSRHTLPVVIADMYLFHDVFNLKLNLQITVFLIFALLRLLIGKLHRQIESAALTDHLL